MNDNSKKIFFDSEKRNQQHSYNLNSFRGLQHNVSDKHKLEKEVKVMMRENTLRASSKKEKETELISKGQIKPKLLTSCLPKAFDVKYGRSVTDYQDSYSPKKLIINKHNMENTKIPTLNKSEKSNNYNTENENAPNKLGMESEEDKLFHNLNPIKQNDNFYKEFFDSSHSKLKNFKNKKYDSDEADKEREKITKPIIIKHQIGAIRQKSASPHLKEKVRQMNYLNGENNENLGCKIKNLSNNYLTPNSNGNEAKSTENNSNYSSSNCNQNLTNQNEKIGTSKTHESFFPKIKNSYEMGVEHKERDDTYEKKEMIDKLINFKKPFRKLKFEENKLIKLENGISIGIINTSNKERVKLFFHVPNFEIYSIKEIPMTSNNLIFSFKEKMTNWNSKIGESIHFVKIYGEYVNNPEGFISLVTEYMDGCSLTDLIDQIGCMNEAILCRLSIQIIQTFSEYEDKFLCFYKDLCSCEILFDKAGNLKIMPNILKNIMSPFKDSDINTCKCNCNSYFSKIHKIVQNLNALIHNKSIIGNYLNNLNISTSHYFHVGFLVLFCALGGNKFKILDVAEKIGSTRDNKLGIDFQKLNFCCLLHFLTSLENSSLFENNKMKISNFINRSKFSENFIDFLCKTLSFTGQFDEMYRYQITNHPWIKVNNFINLNNNYSKVKISFKELIKILREGKSTKKFGQDSLNEKYFSNFLNSLEIILYNNHYMDHEELFNATILNKKVIKELSREFGINRNDLIEKIQNQIKSLKR